MVKLFHRWGEALHFESQISILKIEYLLQQYDFLRQRKLKLFFTGEK